MKIPGEGIGYPLQYSRATLVAQMVKNPPAMQEIKAIFMNFHNNCIIITLCCIHAFMLVMDREAWHDAVHGVPKSQT